MPPTTRKEQQQQPEIYYDRSQADYWLRYPGKPFLNLDWQNVKVHLRMNRVKIDTRFDIDPKDDFDYGITIGDKTRHNLQCEHAVDHAGALAGHRIGPFTALDGRRFLITSEARPVEPKRGPLEWTENFLAHLFGANLKDKEAAAIGHEQVQYFLLWLKFAHESMTKGDFRPAPLLVLAGESGCGKSFLQVVITQFLGGRAAKPWRYMIGKTDFNGELAEAEHLYIEDEAGSTDIRSRRELGEAIKQMTVVEQWSVHYKGKKAFPAQTFKRASMSINNQPEKLAVLPPLDADMQDKISLLHCYDAKPALNDDKTVNQSNLARELPALAWTALRQKAPRSGRVCHHPRYGVASYQHPQLEDMLSALTPESRLLDFIQEGLFSNNGHEAVTCTAAELERRLVGNETFGWQAGKLLPHSSSCGTLLARLALKFPDRFTQTRSKGQTFWTICNNREQ